MPAAPSDMTGKMQQPDAARLIILVDQLLNSQVNAILRHPQLIAAECLWRGLHLLVTELPLNRTVRLKILPATWQEITRDCTYREFDHTWLFELIYNQEFAMPGGEPFGLIIGDYMLEPDLQGHNNTENTLAILANIAAAAFCPFVSGAAPGAVGLTDFQELNRLPDIISQITKARFTRWNALRKREEARFLALAAPRILLRSPYKTGAAQRQDGFHFEEEIAKDGSSLRFGNGCFAFALNVMNNFIRHGWFAGLRGINDHTLEGGYISESVLTPYEEPAAIDTVLRQPPVEIRLTTLQQQQFCAAGIMPLATSYLMEGLIFNSSQSLYLPDKQQEKDTPSLSAMLQYVLCVSRFAHYLKAIMRREIGKNTNLTHLQNQLQNWLLGYTLAGSNNDSTLRARYPLRAFRISVSKVAGRPGIYNCQLDLQPHLHLDQLHVTFRLLVDGRAALSARPAAGYSQ
ncbi:type VI secretion system contractile sheath large subunit [Pseudochrobactrum sp. HB0163]|uniref:type VI secretion system contractile sheath large subunit n=1 Tax=Pseudochrobactrum sp. HB0163 TaxID=3450708 RepID=UPI003F6DD60A